MSVESIGLIGIAALLTLLALRIPVAFAMFLVGFIGIWTVRGWDAAMGILGSETLQSHLPLNWSSCRCSSLWAMLPQPQA